MICIPGDCCELPYSVVYVKKPVDSQKLVSAYRYESECLHNGLLVPVGAYSNSSDKYSNMNETLLISFPDEHNYVIRHFRHGEHDNYLETKSEKVFSSSSWSETVNQLEQKASEYGLFLTVSADELRQAHR